MLLCLLCLSPKTMEAQYVATDMSHPRLVLRRGGEDALKRNIASDHRWTMLNDALLDECENILSMEDISYDYNGSTSIHPQACETVRRSLFMCYAYRLTSDIRFFDKAVDIARRFCALEHWNTYAFLSVAELTIAASFTYDWLYDRLSEADRTMLETNIRDKALRASMDGLPGNPKFNLRWMDVTHNWAQICHGGLAVGAMAIQETCPDLAQTILQRSHDKMFNPMKGEYYPDGAYSQGIGYWGYGSAMNAIYLDCMEKYYGPDSVADLETIPGFMTTGRYFSELITNTLRPFSFCDNSTVSILPEHCIFWFYAKTGDPSLLYYQKQLIDRVVDTDRYFSNGKHYDPELVEGSYGRHMPLMMIWGAGTGDAVTADFANAEEPQDRLYLARGLNPICTMRTGRGKNDIWVGFKAGNPSCAHGHMDVGEFLFEVDGAMFGTDLGSDRYGKLNALKIGSMFKMGEGAIRWTRFMRYNNFSHSTLTINGRYQNLGAKSDFIGCRDEPGLISATADLTPAYSGQVSSLTRTVSIVDDSRIVVEDCICALPDEDAFVVWNLTTESRDWSWNGETNTATLSKFNDDGRLVTVALHFETDCDVCLDATRSAVDDEIRYPDAESPAEGCYFVRIRFKVGASTQMRFVCTIDEII